MDKSKECVCDNGEAGILLYGVVSFDYTDRQYYLHSIDRTRKRAEDHRLMFVEEYRIKGRRAIVRIEMVESDHAFAQSMKI